MKKIFSILLAAVIIVSGGFMSHANAQSKSFNAYSGEELFKGIIFAQGEVAKKLPSIWDDKTIAMSNNKEGLVFTNEVVKNIKEQDSKYFKELEKAVYSGNQLAIEKSLTKGATYFGDFVESTSAASATSSKVAEDSVGAYAVAGLLTVVYAAAAVTTVGLATHAVVATAGGAAVAYFVVTTGKYLWNNSIDPSSDFNTELVINEIATTFAK